MATNDSFEDLLREFKQKLQSGKNLIRDEISEEGITIIDLMAALHKEQIESQRQLVNALAMGGVESLISSFPARQGILAVPAGRTEFDLKTGKVTMSGLPEKEYPMSAGLDQLGVSRFKSAFFYVDQPCILEVDEQANFPLEMGRNPLVFDMKDKVSIESYMPLSMSLVFSSSPIPPVQPVGGIAFWRHGLEGATTDAYQTLRLRPKSVDYHRDNSNPGVATRKILTSSLLTSDDEGMPVVSKLLRKTFIFENEHATNSANVQIRVNNSEGETMTAHPVTGDDGIEVVAGDFAIFHFDELFWRMNPRTKSTTSGASAGDIECGLLGEFS